MLTGRFAPSPTGPLHMGSLLTALASYLDVKARGGRWYVRIDNLDPPREDPNATHAILSSLSAHGLQGDAAVDYQSEHQPRYATALAQLQSHLFYCTCSRRSLAGRQVYPGTCRGNTTPIADAAVRLRVTNTTVTYADTMLGQQRADLAQDYGDFIVKRRDGLWAYNFATAVDDGTDTTHVLRGQDLLHVTPQQIYLMQLLGLPVPTYTHIPLLCFEDGVKLSKQTHAPALEHNLATSNLQAAFGFLGMRPPERNDWNVQKWLDWALVTWPEHELPHQFAHYDST